MESCSQGVRVLRRRLHAPPQECVLHDLCTFRFTTLKHHRPIIQCYKGTPRGGALFRQAAFQSRDPKRARRMHFDDVVARSRHPCHAQIAAGRPRWVRAEAWCAELCSSRGGFDSSAPVGWHQGGDGGALAAPPRHRPHSLHCLLRAWI